MQNEESAGTPYIASSKPQASNDQSSDPDKNTPLKFRHILARVVLAVLFISGFFFSVIPAGRAAARALYILPELILASQLGALSLAEDQIQHVQRTVPSSNGTVYLDIYEPSRPPPLIPGAREGVVVIPGVGDNRT